MTEPVLEIELVDFVFTMTLVKFGEVTVHVGASAVVREGDVVSLHELDLNTLKRTGRKVRGVVASAIADDVEGKALALRNLV